MRALPLLILTLLPALAGAQHDPRRWDVRQRFVATAPCPATGQVARPCPGYEVDHRVPLCAGGADAIENLQWLSIAEHRRKTAAERPHCVARRKAARQIAPGSTIDRPDK